MEDFQMLARHQSMMSGAGGIGTGGQTGASNPLSNATGLLGGGPQGLAQGEILTGIENLKDNPKQAKAAGLRLVCNMLEIIKSSTQPLAIPTGQFADQIKVPTITPMGNKIATASLWGGKGK